MRGINEYVTLTKQSREQVFFLTKHSSHKREGAWSQGLVNQSTISFPVAMNCLGREKSSPSSSEEEDLLIKQILLTHDPDGRCLDSELLLRATETVMSYTAPSQVSEHDVSATTKRGIWNIEVLGSEESLGHTIYKLSGKILCNCSVGENTHAKTMKLLEMLGQYKWDAKSVLVLSAFATSYGGFWLLMQLYPSNPLAALVALLKRFPNDLSSFNTRFKALRELVKTIIDVIKSIIKFENFPLKHVIIENEAIVVLKSQIYVATHWVIRSALTCSSQITDMIALKNVQVHSSSETIASWELSSLVYKLSNISSRLKRQMDLCYQLIETEMHKKLLNLFKSTNIDNQEVLHMLLASKNDLPLQDCSSLEKIGLSKLKNKVVILLVSRPELLPIEVLLMLVQQMFDHPHRLKLEESYEIVWIPISASETWTYTEEHSFKFLSNSLPWYSIRQPQSLSPMVVKLIKQEWNFRDDPLMVVLDTQGRIKNIDGFDMALIWGAKAYPFTISREKELWEEEAWNFQLLLDRIDPLVTKWVEEGQSFCVYGSNNVDWTKEFTSKMRDIMHSGLQMKMVFVGDKTLSEKTRSILATINDEKLSGSLTLTKINFFWLRLDRMRRSKLRLGYSNDKDEILKQLSGLMDTDENEKGWVLIGRGYSTNIVRLEGRKVLECLDLFPEWGEKVGMLGCAGAIRTVIEPPHVAEPCQHSHIIPFVEGLKATILCEKCKQPLEKFVVYKCNVIE